MTTDFTNPSQQPTAPEPGMQPQPGTKAPGATASLVWGIVGLLCIPLIPAIVAVVLGHKALGAVKRSGNTLTGGDLAIGGLITGYLGIAAALLIVPMVFAIVMPALGTAQSKAKEAQALSSAKQLALAAIMYSQENDGVFPKSFEDLTDYVNDPSMYDGSDGGGFTLIPRGNMNAEQNQPMHERALVVENVPNEAGRYAVAYVDGHAKMQDVADQTPEELIAEQTPGR